MSVLNVVGGVAGTVLVGALLFTCAGRRNLPLFWAYLGVWTAWALVGLHQALEHRRLLRKRWLLFTMRQRSV